MPQLLQGNIFDRISENDLAIVFGHIGFGLMKVHWDSFRNGEGALAHIRDPFSKIPEQAYRASTGQFLWFVPDRENNGMTEGDTVEAVGRAIAWAQKNRLTRIVTNGVPDIDHGNNTAANRASDDRRAKFLIEHAERLENSTSMRFELTNLNDTFVRNAPVP